MKYVSTGAWCAGRALMHVFALLSNSHKSMGFSILTAREIKVT